jgi:hypothetical protein
MDLLIQKKGESGFFDQLNDCQFFKKIFSSIDCSEFSSLKYPVVLGLVLKI